MGACEARMANHESANCGGWLPCAPGQLNEVLDYVLEMEYMMLIYQIMYLDVFHNVYSYIYYYYLHIKVIEQ